MRLSHKYIVFTFIKLNWNESIGKYIFAMISIWNGVWTFQDCIQNAVIHNPNTLFQGIMPWNKVLGFCISAFSPQMLMPCLSLRVSHLIFSLSGVGPRVSEALRVTPVEVERCSLLQSRSDWILFALVGRLFKLLKQKNSHIYITNICVSA